MVYRFAVLRTDNSMDAERHNQSSTGPNTLGIEVTRPSLAERCGLGNIDPQHGSESKSSAIEEALTFPLPRDGACLATIRLDKDAVGAMAVLKLRQLGKGSKIDEMLVRWIGALDRMRYPDAKEKYPQLANMFSGGKTDAMNIIVRDKDVRLGQKVHDMGRILCDEMPKEEISWLASLRKQQRDRTDYYPHVEIFGPNVGFVHAPGGYEDARNWGNSRYPVFVVHDPQRHTESGGIQDRWTLVRQQGTFDRVGFEEDINTAEAKTRGLSLVELRELSFAWGGNKNIVSSPQGSGFGTMLSKEGILALARKHADSGVVS